jgi:hypothetical protein
MKTVVLICLMLVSSFSWAESTQTFSNLDDHTNLDNGTTGWGRCSACAGGESILMLDQFSMSFHQHTPSLDGSSLEFFASSTATQPYANALWFYKLGPHDNFDVFQFNFGYRVDVAATTAQALEFDTFQFVNGLNFTFGTQCDLSTGLWNVFDDATDSWIPLRINCTPVADDWYRISWKLHRSSNHTLTYDSFVVQHLNSTGTRLLSQHSFTVGLTVGSAPVPKGFTDNLGVQFQIDLGGNGGMATMFVVKVSLTASGWFDPWTENPPETHSPEPE